MEILIDAFLFNTSLKKVNFKNNNFKEISQSFGDKLKQLSEKGLEIIIKYN